MQGALKPKAVAIFWLKKQPCSAVQLSVVDANRGFGGKSKGAFHAGPQLTTLQRAQMIWSEGHPPTSHLLACAFYTQGPASPLKGRMRHQYAKKKNLYHACSTTPAE
jgi:hypothetical protein